MDNWELSRQRAISVSRELMLFNVPSSMISIGAAGEFNAIASNDDELGRSRNRRVDIYFNLKKSKGSNIELSKKIRENLGEEEQ